MVGKNAVNHNSYPTITTLPHLSQEAGGNIHGIPSFILTTILRGGLG